MNVFQIGQEFLNQQFTDKASVIILYHRGMLFVPIRCWVGRTAFKIQDEKGLRIEWSERDYLIPVELLVLNGVKSVPLEADWIEEVFPEPQGANQYILTAPNDEPIWRFSDVQHTLYRVHCKRTSD